MSGVRTWSRRRSLRARLTIVATVTVAFMLLVAATLLVLGLERSQRAELDDTARETAQAFADQASEGELSRVLVGLPDSDAAAQVVDDGGLVARSPNAPATPLFDFPGSTEGTAHDSGTVPVPDAADVYRVVALNTGDGRYTVYVALAADDVRDTKHLLVGVLLIGVPLLLAVLALLMWILIGRTLRPVERLRRQAAAISATNLHERLTPGQAADELSRLSDTLNELLSRIENATDRQRRFVADAAHELRNPLATMLATLEIAAAYPDERRWQQDRVVLSRELERMTGLVDGLLHLARLDATPQLRRTAVDLDDVVREEVERCRLTRGIHVDTSDVGPAQVTGDGPALARVVRNLLENSARYARTEVGVGVSTSNGHAVVVVRDDGPGIAAADRQRVFERFTRLDDARARTDGGFGLGLAIVREVVEAHGGEVVVADDAPGTRIVVRLPLNGA